MPAHSRFALFMAALLLWSPAASAAGSVEGYWLWAGVPPASVPATGSLYIYQGIVKQDKAGTRFAHKGIYPSPIKAGALYLSFRLEGTLPDAAQTAQLMESQAREWETHGNKINGIQLDFDSPTGGLLVYSSFLKDFRTALPTARKLSVTGLGDWVAHGDPKALAYITGTADELIFQLYQGRRPLPDMDFYVDLLCRIQVPFKIGLLEKENRELMIAKLQQNRYFSGTILFVQR